MYTHSYHTKENTMTEALKDKNLTGEEIQKLKSVVNSLVVSLVHIDDIREQMKEMVAEIAEDLDIKKPDISALAATLHKQNIAEKRAKQEALEELMETLGYEVDFGE